MELKLMLVSHKKDFGSTMSFSKNVEYSEKELLKSVKYSNYSAHEKQIFEVEADGCCLYFVTFIGGHDEYGREYQSVISSIFTFKLRTEDLFELRKSFDILKEDINNEDFTLNKKVYVRIANKTKNVESEIPKIKVNPFKLLRSLLITVVFIVLIIYTAMLAFQEKTFVVNLKSKFSFTSKNKENFDIVKRYTIFKKTFEKEIDDLSRYRLYIEFLEKEKQYATKYLEEADDKLYIKLEALDLDDLYESEKNLEKINSYLEVKEFKKNRDKVEAFSSKIMQRFDKDAYKRIEARILKYNNNINYEDLVHLIDECKIYQREMEKGKYRKKVTAILKKAQNLKRGKSLELEIYVVDKSYVFNNKEIQVKIFSKQTNENTYKKRKKLGTNRDVYIGSFYNFLKLNDKFEVDVSIYRSGGRKEDIKSIDLSFTDLNKLIKLSNKNGNGFKLEIKVNTDVFKIKY